MKTTIQYLVLLLFFLFTLGVQAQQVNLLDNDTEDANFESITTTKTWPPKGVWGKAGGGSINANTTVRTQNLTDSALNAGTNPLWKSRYSYLFVYMKGSNTPCHYVWRKLSNLTPGKSYTVSFWYKTPASTAFTPAGHVKFGVVTDIVDIQVGAITNPISPVVEFGHVEPVTGTEVGSVTEHKLVKNKFTVPAGKTEVYVAWVRSTDAEQQIYVDNMSLVEGDYTGIKEIKLVGNLKVYPNPTSKYLYFNNDPTTSNSISIFNLQGKTVKTIKDTSNKIDVGNLSNGMYILKSIANDGISTGTFIKK